MNTHTYDYLKKEIDKIIVDLDEQKEQLLAIYLKHYRERRNFKKGDRRIIPLLMGPSGLGKTTMVQALAKITNREFYCIDASNTAANGYKGQDLSEKLGMFYSSINKDKTKFSNSIIFIDEFDKLVTNTYKHQCGNMTDQQQYLSFLDSDSFTISCERDHVMVDTSNVFIILAGAFSDLYRLQKQESQSFGLIKESKSYLKESTDISKLIHGLEDYGIVPEIIGRISVLISFPKSNRNTVLKIMSSDKGVLSKWRTYFNLNYNVELSINNKAREYIADSIINLPLGVRAINHYVNPIMNKALIDVEKDMKINKVKVFYDEKIGLYAEYVHGRPRKKLKIEYMNEKQVCPNSVIGIQRIRYIYADSRKEIERFVEMYTDRFSRECYKVSFKYLKLIESLYRSTLMYLASEVGYSEVNEDSLLKLLDVAVKEGRSNCTTFSIMIERECRDNNEYKQDIIDNYANYLTIYHRLCTDEIKDCILLSVMQTQIEGEK